MFTDMLVAYLIVPFSSHLSIHTPFRPRAERSLPQIFGQLPVNEWLDKSSSEPFDKAESKVEMSSETERKYLAPTSEEFQAVAFLAKSLSDENRLRILHFVSDGKKSVGSIVEGLNLSQPLVSHHLRELKRSLLVKVERNGPFIFYELADPRILDVARTLSFVAADLLTARKTF
jgi:ArsR family transcriptional regulator, zinc-responsive transcriptional repressor